jgi:hypothetical protein
MLGSGFQREISPSSGFPNCPDLSHQILTSASLNWLPDCSLDWLAIEVEVNLRPTDSRPACLGVGFPSGANNQIFVLSENCGFLYVGHHLWWKDESLLYSYNCLWPLPEQSLSDPSPAEPTSVLYCLIKDSANLKGQVPLFTSPRNRVAQLYPRALSDLLVASYDLQGCGGSTSINPPPQRNDWQSSQSHVVAYGQS